MVLRSGKSRLTISAGGVDCNHIRGCGLFTPRTIYNTRPMWCQLSDLFSRVFTWSIFRTVVCDANSQAGFRRFRMVLFFSFSFSYYNMWCQISDLFSRVFTWSFLSAYFYLWCQLSDLFSKVSHGLCFNDSLGLSALIFSAAAFFCGFNLGASTCEWPPVNTAAWNVCTGVLNPFITVISLQNDQ